MHDKLSSRWKLSTGSILALTLKYLLSKLSNEQLFDEIGGYIRPNPLELNDS